MAVNRNWEHLRNMSTDLISLDKEIVATGSVEMERLDEVIYDAYRLMSILIPDHLKYIGEKRRVAAQPKKNVSATRNNRQNYSNNGKGKK